MAAGYLNYRALVGERHFSQAQVWVKSDPLQTLVAANEAYKANPFEIRYRLQLVVSVEQLARSDKKVNLHPSAADKAYQIALTASPNHQAVLLARVQYLVNSKRWQESGEAAELIEKLKTTASTHPETWMAVAYFSGLTGETGAAISALKKAIERNGDIAAIKRIARQMNMEITEQ